MNVAYRGEAAGGWTIETDYISGDRTSEALIEADMTERPHGRLLITRSDDGAIVGCVWLEPAAARKWYLGSLAVDPARQNGHIGRRLLEAAETWVREHGGTTIRMTVVIFTGALITWYLRRGYRLTGETEPFPRHDPRVGIPKRNDLHFVVLEKGLVAAQA